MKYFISIILVIISFGCKTTEKDITSTYFGGEIINPKSNFVLLLKDDTLIDTLLLNENNQFLNKYKSIEEGLYTFKHGNEFQYIYIEPTDSILVRLNTWDFDESLVYSGKGSSKNEFLINLFLQNEKESKKMHQFFNLDEQEFQRKIDSLSKEKILIFNEFSSHEILVSEGFKELTIAAINYPLYRSKEIYPYSYKRFHKLDKSPSLSHNYYNFRNNVNLNEEHLVSFYPYQNYIIGYLYNLSYQLKEKDSSKKNITANILNYTIEKIKLEKFKNTLLKGIVVNDFLKSESTCSINKEVLNIFLENCSNQPFINQVENLVNDSKFVTNKKPLHNFEIVSYNNIKHKINDIVKNKNSVIYFWSTEYISSDYLVKRIKYLENNYPNTLFIGINMQNTSENITNDPNLKLLNFTTQYKLTKTSFAHNYLTSKYPRTILINNKGIVENGFTYLDSKKLSLELHKLK